MKEFEIIQARDREIEDLKKKLNERDAEIEQLKADIRDKYQSYIDNYESIGSLVYDAKIRSEQMIRDAEEQRRAILESADQEAKQKIDDVQIEIDKRIDEGEQRYKTVEEELQGILGMINQVQKKFMESYRSINGIVRDLPGMEQQNPEDF
ncbi:MAG: hypothetical protein IJ239_06390 [Eubacterium sp.]|nr:hypothetical protein [Eubacterium sp.]MBQ9321961.1 hypothetical protein [Eubacterium sp.]